MWPLHDFDTLNVKKVVNRAYPATEVDIIDVYPQDRVAPDTEVFSANAADVDPRRGGRDIGSVDAGRVLDKIFYCRDPGILDELLVECAHRKRNIDKVLLAALCGHDNYRGPISLFACLGISLRLSGGT